MGSSSGLTQRLVVLTGNPNCGKTTLFNAFTGLRAKVGNYAGVTVERKEGRLRGTPPHQPVTVLDLPGAYSLSPRSADEQIARDVLLHRLPDVPPPDLVVAVVDASNLERHLYFATQVAELGLPTVIALNMIDVAEQNGHEIDIRRLEEALGLPVFPMVASTGRGVDRLHAHVVSSLSRSDVTPSTPRRCPLPPALDREVRQLAARLPGPPRSESASLSEALLLLGDDRPQTAAALHRDPGFAEALAAARAHLEQAGIDWRSSAIEARYGWVGHIHHQVTTERLAAGDTTSDRIDRWVTHPVWGVVLFLLLIALMFQGIFTLAHWPMAALEHGVDWLGRLVESWIPPGDFQSLVVNGAIAGAGSVLVFLPQIVLLFVFIGLLEDTGYMARAAFLMDRLMSRVGLHGKSCIPLLSSFACAIPGILATRTIESQKDRLATMLVAPLMSCSARLPVYTLLIAACIPNRPFLGPLRLPGLTLLAMYLLGILVALAVAWLLKRTLLRGEPPLLILELPPYRRPQLRQILWHVWERARLFIQNAGTIILGASICLWFLASYPRHAETTRRYNHLRATVAQTAARYGDATPSVRASLDAQLAAINRQEAGERLRNSFAGHLGRIIEPAIAPLGFDWKIGIGIISSFAARELFVSTLSTVYNVGGGDPSDQQARALAGVLKSQTRPDGTPLYTVRTGLALMLFYVFALQCVSTVAVVRRESNSWKWPIFQWFYMAVLAWIFAFVASQGSRVLGWE